MEKVSITTEDNITISGLYWRTSGQVNCLLLHMMPATKESWNALAEKLAAQNCNVLAIDFRGHGQSTGGDYHNFTSEQHQEYYKDVEAAVKFLNDQSPTTKLAIAGASIGANLALKYLSEHHDASRAVSLSAGLDYHGVPAIDYIKLLSPTQEVLFVASSDDGNCATMAEELYNQAISQKQKILYETGGHGTDMFNTHPELIDQAASFLAK